MITSISADLRLFWTAYDPLDLASGSIDVLGFQRGYIALADKLLPGFTTITTSPRYVSMLCAAIRRAQEEFPESATTPIQLRQKRLAAVKSYERAWALACGLASENGVGYAAVDGLRGIRSIRRRLSELSGREKYIRTSSFNLLANQVRYGGIGAYSALLDDCHLASMRSLSLRPLGLVLAEAFPWPAVDLAVHDEDQPLPLDGLADWGQQCHLGSFEETEAKTLSDALRGGEEGGWEDDVRWTMLRLLAGNAKKDEEESDLFDRILTGIENRAVTRLRMPANCVQQIHAALVLIRPFELFYQSCQFLFDAIRAAATDEPEVGLKEVAGEAVVIAAYEAAKLAAAGLTAALGQARDIHLKTASDVQSVLVESGIAALLPKVLAAVSPLEIVSLVLDRHLDVQQGKFDRDERKSPWIRRSPTGGKVRLTAQRYQILVSQRWDGWQQVPWHPYRTIGALRFIRRCNIR